MACLHPVSIFVDGKQMFVPCGRCALCTVRQATDWLTRLNLAFSNGITVFLTLTYNDIYIPVISEENEYYNPDNVERYSDVPVNRLHHYFPTFLYADYQRYFKRLRKQGLKFSYYGVTEYGPNTFRPHAHILVNFPELCEQDFSYIQETTFMAWNFGFSSCEFSTIQRLKYCLFYSKKIQGSEVSDYLEEHPFLRRPFSFMSKGLGKEFAMQNFDFIATHSYLRDKNGRILHTPRYFRKKVFELLDEPGMIKMREVYDYSKRIDSDELRIFNDWLVKRHENTTMPADFRSHPLYPVFFDDYYQGLEYQNEFYKVKLSKKQNSKL